MYEINKSFLALDDLKGIWHYSLNKWGDAKAADYLRELDTGIQRLTVNPEMGKPRDRMRKGFRSIQINHHVVFYQIKGQIIHIIRVLHERQLPAKHL